MTSALARAPRRVAPDLRGPQRLAILLALAVILAACGAGDGGAGIDRDWVAVHDTVGDTIIVRTVAGSVWRGEARLVPEVTIGTLEGEDAYMFGRINAIAVDDAGAIYVYDAQARALRKYGPDGEYLMTIGRAGQGPGEYRNPDSGLGILPDGRIVLRDPGNARFQLYTADGAPAGTVPLRGGYMTTDPLVIDAEGGIYTPAILGAVGPDQPLQMGMVRYRPDGQPGDTVVQPTWGGEAPLQLGDTVVQPKWGEDPPELTATMEGGFSRRPVPFAPRSVSAFSPIGQFLGGFSDRYALHVPQPDGRILRIERTVEPVPVHPEEWERAERLTIRAMRRVQSDWRWNGPSVPGTKPVFHAIQVGQDGRLWVAVSQPAEPVPADEIEEPDDDLPPQRWREPLVYDVFEADGRYLGPVRVPAGFQPYPHPVFRGDHVWAVVLGEFDVPTITRFRIEH